MSGLGEPVHPAAPRRGRRTRRSSGSSPASPTPPAAATCWPSTPRQVGGHRRCCSGRGDRPARPARPARPPAAALALAHGGRPTTGGGPRADAASGTGRRHRPGRRVAAAGGHHRRPCSWPGPARRSARGRPWSIAATAGRPPAGSGGRATPRSPLGAQTASGAGPDHGGAPRPVRRPAPILSAVRARAPASAANLGPGFDVLALALDLYVEVEVEPAPPADGAVRGRRGRPGRRRRPPGGPGGHRRGRPRPPGHHRAIRTSPWPGASAPRPPWPWRPPRRPGSQDPLAVAARVDGHPENAAASGGRVAWWPPPWCAGRSGPCAWRSTRRLVFVAMVPDRPLPTSRARQALPGPGEPGRRHVQPGPHGAACWPGWPTTAC